jgi:hypothetical protein
MAEKKNIFGKAKEKAPAKAKKDDKIVVKVDGKEFAEKLSKFAILKSQIEQLETELAMSQDFVKSTCIEKFAELYESKKTSVGSFNVEAEDGSSVMFLPTKKYIKIDEAQANVLKETYGDAVVEETTSYGFNTDILMKNMNVISKLIEESDEISDSDKENLIEAKTAITVEKDALDKVYTYATESGNSVKDVLTDLQPVYQMKNARTAKKN